MPEQSVFSLPSTGVPTLINSSHTGRSGVNPNQLIKIKLEVDTDPPAGGQVETRYQLNPIPYNIRIFTLPTLFARSWKNRVKGRDYYDHLRNRLIQSGHLEEDAPWDENVLQGCLADRFSTVDFTEAREDVRPYIDDTSSLELWSEEFFLSVTRDRLRVTDSGSPH